MKIINDNIDGDVKVKGCLVVNGIITGSVTIYEEAEFTLNGIILENVILKQAAKAKICGIVNGDVQNNGGILEIFGIVAGNIHTNSGTTYYAFSKRDGGCYSCSVQCE